MNYMHMIYMIYVHSMIANSGKWQPIRICSDQKLQTCEQVVKMDAAVNP